MSGVQSGTRLERLEQLHRRVRHELAIARRHGLVDETRLAVLDARLAHEITTLHRARPTVAAAVRQTDRTVQERLEQLGVTSHVVKQWAVDTGLIPAVVRGRVSGLLVDAYAQAHPQPQEHQ